MTLTNAKFKSEGLARNAARSQKADLDAIRFEQDEASGRWGWTTRADVNADCNPHDALGGIDHVSNADHGAIESRTNEAEDDNAAPLDAPDPGSPALDATQETGDASPPEENLAGLVVVQWGEAMLPAAASLLSQEISRRFGLKVTTRNAAHPRQVLDVIEGSGSKHHGTDGPTVVQSLYIGLAKRDGGVSAQELQAAGVSARPTGAGSYAAIGKKIMTSSRDWGTPMVFETREFGRFKKKTFYRLVPVLIEEYEEAIAEMAEVKNGRRTAQKATKKPASAAA